MSLSPSFSLSPATHFLWLVCNTSNLYTLLFPLKRDNYFSHVLGLASRSGFSFGHSTVSPFGRLNPPDEQRQLQAFIRMSVLLRLISMLALHVQLNGIKCTKIPCTILYCIYLLFVLYRTMSLQVVNSSIPTLSNKNLLNILTLDLYYFFILVAIVSVILYMYFQFSYETFK